MAGLCFPVCSYQPSFRHRNPMCSAALSPPSISGVGFASRCALPLRFCRARILRNLQAHGVSRENSLAVVSGESTETSNSSVKLTYLEGNSWLWDVGGVNVLVDPILVGNLDFGIPWLYEGAKKVLKNFQLKDLPELDCLLITQSLDDHCHLKTLKPLSELRPDIRVVATPNAESILNPLFKNVTYLEPGERHELIGRNGIKLSIQATAGPVLGPPWQRPENGYIVTNGENCPSLYYEPHCGYDTVLIEKLQADIIITPVIKQLLPYFTLVYGQEDAVRLAKLLRAKFVVVMNNGKLDNTGILSKIVQPQGTVESFKEILSREAPEVRMLEPMPGVALEVPVASGLP